MRIRSIFRISLIVFGCFVLLFMMAAGATWGVFRSAWGQRKVTHWISERLEKSIRGHVSIGGISIPQWGALQLRDIKIVDLHGEEAIYIRNIQAHWSILELRHARLSSLSLEGVVVSFYQTSDQSTNLQKLVDLNAPSTALRIAACSIEGQIQGTLPVSTIFFQLKTTLSSTQESIRFDGAKIDLRTKLDGSALQGTLVPVLKKVFGFEPPILSAEVALEGSGGIELSSNRNWHILPTQLQLRVVPDSLPETAWFTPQGPWVATVDIAGTQADVTGHLVMDLPIGTSKVTVHFQMDPNGGHWHIDSDIQLNQLQRWFPLLPEASLYAQISSDLDSTTTYFVLKKFELKQRKNLLQLVANAKRKKQQWERAEFQILLRWRKWALERWLKVSPGLGGNIDFSAYFSMVEKSWQGKATLRANQLHVQGSKLDKLTASIEIRNNLFNIIGNMIPTTGKKTKIQLVAQGTPSRWGFQARGIGLRSSAFYITGQGKVAMAGTSVQEAELSVQRASVSIDKVQLGLLKPFLIRWSTDDKKIKISNVLIGYGTQRLTAYGMYQTSGGILRFHVNTEQLDLRSWAPLIPALSILPHTSFTLRADVGGTLSNPQASLYFDGKSYDSKKLGLQQAQYQMSASWREGQIVGRFLVASPRTQIQSSFSIPIDTEKSLQLSLDGKIPLELVRALLPDALREIEGRGVLQIRVGGSIRNPNLSASLRIPDWKFSQLQGRDALLELKMADRRVEMHGGVTFLDMQGTLLGTVSLHSSAVANWDEWISARSLKQHLWTLDWNTKISARLDRLNALLHRDLVKQFPLDKGNLLFQAELQGSLADPRIKATLQGQEWTWLGLRNVFLDTQLELVSENKKAVFSWKTKLNKKPWIQGEGIMPVDLEHWIKDPSVISTVPLQAHVAMLPRDLSEVSSWSGVVQSQFDVQGPLSRLRMSLGLTGSTLRFGDLFIPRVQLTASSNGKDPFVETMVRFDSPEPQDGIAELSARVPWPFDPAGIQATFRAKKFLLKYQTNKPEWFGVRFFRGIVDAQLSFGMISGQPVLSGEGTLSQGTLETNFDQRSYKNVSLSIASRPNNDNKGIRLELSNFFANIEEGTVKGQGSATIEGGQLIDAAFVVSTKHLTLLQGALPLHLDATVDIRGRARGSDTDIELLVLKGRAVIPKLQAGAGMQSLNTPSQIRYQGKRAEEEARRIVLRNKLVGYIQPAGQTQLHIHIPTGTLRLEGPDLSIATEGDVTIVTGDKGSVINGEIRSLSGADIQLADKHYDLIEAGLSFSGFMSNLDPQINIRMGRPITGGTLYIRVQGPLSKPKTQIWAEPPGYSQIQLLMLAAGGEVDGPGSNTEGESLNATGIVTGFLTSQLKEKFGVLIPVDSLRVSANRDEGLTGLEVGKRLFNNKLSVSYTYVPSGNRIGQGASNVHQGCIQYAFLRGSTFCQRHPILCTIQLNGCLGDAGLGNVALLWQFPLDYSGKLPQPIQPVPAPK